MFYLPKAEINQFLPTFKRFSLTLVGFRFKGSSSEGVLKRPSLRARQKLNFIMAGQLRKRTEENGNNLFFEAFTKLPLIIGHTNRELLCAKMHCDKSILNFEFLV